jgi:3-hydroxybutyryl-CoA dehydratase
MTLAVGQKAHTTRTFSADDVAGYVALGGHAPADGEVPEPLVNALFSRLLGVDLPGQGTNYLKQECAFFDRARVGEALTASVEITRLRPEKDLVDLCTRCSGEHGRLISEGRALVYVADAKAWRR